MLQMLIQGKLGLICIQFVCGISVEDVEVKCVHDVCGACYVCVCVCV